MAEEKAGEARVEYVLGFIFDAAGEEVLLCQKKRPAWQAGKYNGIGGHVEAGETSYEAMAREAREEVVFTDGSPFVTAPSDWEWFATMSRSGDSPFVCQCFRLFMTKEWALYSLRGTDERVENTDVRNVEHLAAQGKAISNLPWLVAMALDRNPGDGGAYEVIARVGPSLQPQASSLKPVASGGAGAA